MALGRGVCSVGSRQALSRDIKEAGYLGKGCVQLFGFQDEQSIFRDLIQYPLVMPGPISEKSGEAM